LFFRSSSSFSPILGSISEEAGLLSLCRTLINTYPRLPLQDPVFCRFNPSLRNSHPQLVQPQTPPSLLYLLSSNSTSTPGTLALSCLIAVDPPSLQSSSTSSPPTPLPNFLNLRFSCKRTGRLLCCTNPYIAPSLLHLSARRSFRLSPIFISSSKVSAFPFSPTFSPSRCPSKFSPRGATSQDGRAHGTERKGRRKIFSFVHLSAISSSSFFHFAETKTDPLFFFFSQSTLLLSPPIHHSILPLTPALKQLSPQDHGHLRSSS